MVRKTTTSKPNSRKDDLEDILTLRDDKSSDPSADVEGARCDACTIWYHGGCTMLPGKHTTSKKDVYKLNLCGLLEHLQRQSQEPSLGFWVRQCICTLLRRGWNEFAVKHWLWEPKCPPTPTAEHEKIVRIRFTPGCQSTNCSRWPQGRKNFRLHLKSSQGRWNGRKGHTEWSYHNPGG